MIVAAGLTPAWQHLLSFDALELGEVNRARDVRWFASGKVLNAALAARHLGAKVRVVAPLGGTAHEPIAHELDELGIFAHWVVTESATRVCTTLIDEAKNQISELVENQPPLTTDELTTFVEVYGESVSKAKAVVLAGSLPAGTPTTFYRDLLAATSCPVVIDARGPELLAALEHRPLLVKPNREELARSLGHAMDRDDDLLAGMRSLQARGAQWVLITDGPRVVWLASSEAVYHVAPPPVERVVNPIGCGDSLAGALAFSLSEGRDVMESVKIGMAAAADNLTTLLPGRVESERVKALAEQVLVERI